MPGSDLLEARLRVFQAWFVGAVALGIVVFVLSVAFMLFATLSIQGSVKDHQAALCSLRKDIQVRYDAGLEFLKDNPAGIPGISAEQIRQSLDNQRATLNALSPLSC